MEYQLSSTSTAPLVEISLDDNEEIQIESGSMVYHNAAVKLEGKMNSNGKGGLGGALKALGRSITSGESFFITKASAIGANGKISLAPASLGSIKEILVGQEQWKPNTGAFLWRNWWSCCDENTGQRKDVNQRLRGYCRNSS